MTIFDNRFKALAHLHGEKTETLTPAELCREIISKLPSKGFRDLNSTFCDPCCGKGAFLLAIAERCFYEMIDVIPDEKQRIKHIVQTKLYGYDIRAKQVCTTITTLKMLLRDFNVESTINVYQKNSLKLTNERFDYVVGNAPFEEDKVVQTSVKPWKLFLLKSGELTKDGGAFAFITPNGWGMPSDNKKLINELFTVYNLVYANISTVKKWFSNTGSFGYTITIKEPYGHKTVLLCEEGEYTVDLTKIKLIVSRGMSIVEKLILSKNERCNFKLGGKDVEYSGDGYHPSEERPTTAIYKNIHSMNSGKDYEPGTKIPIRYSVEPSPIRNRKKVVIPYAGPATVIVDDGKYGVRRVQVLLLNDTTNIKNVESVFHSKLFTFFIRNANYTGYNETRNLSQFPLLDFTQSWTDEKLYKYFNLTSDEINLIETFQA